jgi:DNA-directed RNA polymerase specialized sigma24 family protein
VDQDDFDRFLTWLNPEREKATIRYEEIRRRLIKLFVARGFVEAEEMADATFDRVAIKLREIADTYVGDPASYVYRVAQFIMMEWRRRSPLPPSPPPQPDSWDEKEPRYACLDLCMSRLPADDRQLLLDYYADEGREKIERRRELAEARGLTENALRIHLTRLRKKLRECINDCLKDNSE